MKLSPTTHIITIETSGEHSILRKPTHMVEFPLSPIHQEIISKMREKLYQLEGVGLAAPQVNIDAKIIAIYIPKSAALLRDNAKEHAMHILINAKYEGIEEDGKEEDFEACYSVGSTAGKVPRYRSIKLDYQDETGQTHQSIETGFYARVLQHEIDHLNCTLIIDRLKSDSIQGSLQEMMELRYTELSVDKQQQLDKLMQKKQSD